MDSFGAGGQWDEKEMKCEIIFKGIKDLLKVFV
jgi:hypothetical protein